MTKAQTKTSPLDFDSSFDLTEVFQDSKQMLNVSSTIFDNPAKEETLNSSCVSSESSNSMCGYHFKPYTGSRRPSCHSSYADDEDSEECFSVCSSTSNMSATARNLGKKLSGKMGKLGKTRTISGASVLIEKKEKQQQQQKQQLAQLDSTLSSALACDQKTSTPAVKEKRRTSKARAVRRTKSADDIRPASKATSSLRSIDHDSQQGSFLSLADSDVDNEVDREYGSLLSSSYDETSSPSTSHHHLDKLVLKKHGNRDPEVNPIRRSSSRRGLASADRSSSSLRRHQSPKRTRSFTQDSSLHRRGKSPKRERSFRQDRSVKREASPPRDRIFRQEQSVKQENIIRRDRNGRSRLSEPVERTGLSTEQMLLAHIKSKENPGKNKHSGKNRNAKHAADKKHSPGHHKSDHRATLKRHEKKSEDRSRRGERKCFDNDALSGYFVVDNMSQLEIGSSDSEDADDTHVGDMISLDSNGDDNNADMSQVSNSDTESSDASESESEESDSESGSNSHPDFEEMKNRKKSFISKIFGRSAKDLKDQKEAEKHSLLGDDFDEGLLSDSSSSESSTEDTDPSICREKKTASTQNIDVSLNESTRLKESRHEKKPMYEDKKQRSKRSHHHRSEKKTRERSVSRSPKRHEERKRLSRHSSGASTRSTRGSRSSARSSYNDSDEESERTEISSRSRRSMMSNKAILDRAIGRLHDKSGRRGARSCMKDTGDSSVSRSRCGRRTSAKEVQKEPLAPVIRRGACATGHLLDESYYVPPSYEIKDDHKTVREEHEKASGEHKKTAEERRAHGKGRRGRRLSRH